MQVILMKISMLRNSWQSMVLIRFGVGHMFKKPYPKHKRRALRRRFVEQQIVVLGAGRQGIL